MGMGLDDDMREENAVVSLEERKQRRAFAYWSVGGEEFKLKLTTSVICQLEEKYKCNLLTLLERHGGMMPLSIMLMITQGAMKTWKSGIRYEHVQALFDKYCEEGGTQLTFMADVLMPIYQVSGFFSESQQETMDRKTEELKELL